MPNRITTPSALRAFAVAAAVVTVLLVATAGAAIRRDGAALAEIGDRAAPQVSAASDLYFSLNDMDAQLANVLLVGEATDLGLTRAQALAIYEERRREADQALQQAAAADDADPAARRSVGLLLDDFGHYQALAARTLLAGPERCAGGPSLVRPLDGYRQANALLRSALLPNAQQLTERNGRRLEAAYDDGRGHLQTSRAWFLGTGIALLTVLVGLQVFCARRFHRLTSPFLIMATILAVIGVVAGTALLSRESEHLRVAKEDAFDSVTALSGARAISYDANADESRYLLDPARAQQYEQSFLSKSQQVLELPGATLATWDTTLSADVAAYQRDPDDVRWGGRMGTEFRNITFAGERAAALDTLLRYQTYQVEDRRIRALNAAGERRAAIAFCTSYTPGQSNDACARYDRSLTALIAINQTALRNAVERGRRELAGRAVAGAGAGVVLILLVGPGRNPPTAARIPLTTEASRTDEPVPARSGPGHPTVLGERSSWFHADYAHVTYPRVSTDATSPRRHRSHACAPGHPRRVRRGCP